MPALSPTMTEGKIATWKVKEGESFSAGDVLLEIETDKATMDVEAQDDGVMMRIMKEDGSAAVQVGTRIAVIAEPGDDISSLEIPADEAPASAPAPPAEARSESAPTPAPEKKKSAVAASGVDGGKGEVKYPLLPSVQSLVHAHGLDEAAVAQITPTGPKGRILKGDVLAYVGSVKPEAPTSNSARFENLSHLDLSNIKVAPQKQAPAPAQKKAAAAEQPARPAPPPTAEVSVPVSMARVIETQKKIHKSVGAFLPLSTFISRAADVANEELPPAPRGAPTADELFDAVLGIEGGKATAASRGAYSPRISVLRELSAAAGKSATSARKADIFDILAGGKQRAAPPPRGPSATPGLSTGTNIFSLEVPRAEEKRATVFLERVKLILENEPARLVV
ncbi:related to pyruvate dehydrogenase complex protein X precursor, dihydrolipoamide acetyltransferase [Cephalotrichum gorgonifer]|uniref:Related to pyruvate dehydrogenase complex protein X, dihydrolipoamide acetyltransferase n=1 Tax=Cephalotrichum gorgonifer TaxID=2041049 RepID=A0AAE8SUN9_9PEZI|nr:related to pyruvate dehydrogenase complex protein X precursor, dihydrolipoamide acetyltransferase [Cephalotrichum gorgonifer]